jgi:hypothetical protein
MQDYVRSGSGQSWEGAAQSQKTAPSTFLSDQRHTWTQAGLHLVSVAGVESMTRLGFATEAEEEQCCTAAELCPGYGTHCVEHSRRIRSVVPNAGRWVAARRQRRQLVSVEAEVGHLARGTGMQVGEDAVHRAYQ